MDENDISYEMLIIDDGSVDDTWKIAESLEQRHYNVSAFRLSRNYGEIYAALAGLKACVGGIVLLSYKMMSNSYMNLWWLCTIYDNLVKKL